MNRNRTTRFAGEKSVTRRGALRRLAGSAAAATAFSATPFIQCSSHRKTSPNIIFIYPDQLRQEALGCYGNTICRTPMIDRLAAGGMRFDNLTTPAGVCSPSRACILTGMYPHRHGVVTNNITLGKNRITIADVLRAKGYECIYTGKWHLTDVGLPGFVPPEFRHGFNRWITFNRGHQKKYRTFIQDDDTLVQTDRYSTDGVVEDALQLMDQCGNTPFCCFMSIPDPHQPWSVREPYDTMYDPAALPLADNYIDDISRVAEGRAKSLYRLTQQRIEGWMKSHGSISREAAFKEIKAQYYGMIGCLDENVGKVTDWLQRRGMEEDTIIIFTTDHGEFMSAHGMLYKSVHYEEAYRLPFIILYPRLISPGSASGVLASVIDVMPTLMDLTGNRPPDGVQGVTLTGIIRGDDDSLRDAVFWELQQQRTMRTREWKYIYNHDAPDELYDLVNDPGELRNQIGDNDFKEVRDEMYIKLKYWVRNTNSDIQLA